MICLLETDDGILRTITHPSISPVVEFKLDRAHVIIKDELFELYNGQWFTLGWEDGERVRHPLNGRWYRVRNGNG